MKTQVTCKSNYQIRALPSSPPSPLLPGRNSFNHLFAVLQAFAKKTKQHETHTNTRKDNKNEEQQRSKKNTHTHTKQNWTAATRRQVETVVDCRCSHYLCSLKMNLSLSFSSNSWISFVLHHLHRIKVSLKCICANKHHIQLSHCWCWCSRKNEICTEWKNRQANSSIAFGRLSCSLCTSIAAY